MTLALAERSLYERQIETISDEESSLIAAICNRISRMIGLSDRDGLQQDFAIVQDNYPIDLEALLASPDDVLVQELLRIVDHTDRVSGTLHGGYSSRFRRNVPRG